MKLLATILVLLLPALNSTARYHSSISFFAARTLTLGSCLPAILSDSASAPALNDSLREPEKSSEPTTTSNSAVEINTKFISGDLFNQTRPPSQNETQVESSNLASSEFEIDIRSEPIPTLVSEGESCGAEPWDRGAASKRPKPWPGNMLGARYHYALADAIIANSSRIAISDGDGDRLTIVFMHRRWRDAETISNIRSPTNSLFKHPATRKPPDPGIVAVKLEQSILGIGSDVISIKHSCDVAGNITVEICPMVEVTITRKKNCFTIRFEDK